MRRNARIYARLRPALTSREVTVIYASGSNSGAVFGRV